MGSAAAVSATPAAKEILPYWHVNVAPSDREAECPDFLRNLSAKDEGIIGTRDEDFRVLAWDEVRQIIADNGLDRFRRVPSDLRRYLEYNAKLRRDYGSVMDFVLTQRLGWEAPVRSSTGTTTPGQLFDVEEDVKILWNDWPYGIDPRIVHLVVWTKFDLEEDPVTTDLTDRARQEIETFVQHKFGSKVPRDRVSPKYYAPATSFRCSYLERESPLCGFLNCHSPHASLVPGFPPDGIVPKKLTTYRALQVYLV